MNKKEKIFILYLIILQLLVIIRNIQIQNFESFLYFCNHISIFIILFLIFERYDYLKALINVGFLIQIGWILDFLTKLIFGFYLFSSTDYIFADLYSFTSLISILIHSTTLIPLFFLIRKKRTSKKSIYYSIIYIIILYLTGLLFTNPLYDINCVFNACNINFLQFNLFTWFYLPITIILVILPSFLLQKRIQKM